MKFVNEKQMIMTTNLLSNTATLIVRIPGYVEIPAYQEKSRAKRTIIRTLIRSLQLKDLELVYAGQFPDDALAGASAANSDGTLVSINVLNPGRSVSEFNHSQETLVRRFRKELQSNSEQILIDRTSGGSARFIEIYLRSRFQEPAMQQPRYAFAVSSGSYHTMSPSF